MSIYILQSKNIEYLGLSDKTVFIESKMRARVLNLTHNYYKSDTITPYPIFFYSPERINQYHYSIQLDTNQKKKSDVYSFGVLMYELFTRKKHSKAYFNNIPYLKTVNKLQNGALQYLNFDEIIPFYNLICECLQNDSNKRCGIEYVIEQLLNIEKFKNSASITNHDFFDINLVDLDKYHQFIIDIFGFNNDIIFFEAKNLIISMTQNKCELLTENNEFYSKCTFEDLEKGYNKGLLYCYETIQKCYEKLDVENQILYKKFVKENPKISEFKVMKIFYQNRFNLPKLQEELNKLSLKMKNKFNEFPIKVKFNQNLNLYDVLYDGALMKSITFEMKFKWLISIIKQVKKLNDLNCHVLFFSNKNIYLNEKMEAVLYVPEVLQIGSNDKDEDLSKELEKRLKIVNKNCISIYYRSPELLEKHLKPEEIHFDKCSSYSLGVLAKELFEFNLPWTILNNLSNKTKMKTLKNPHWKKFQSYELEKELNKENFSFEEKEKFLLNLYQCLNTDQKQRVSINEMFDSIKNK